ncbi:hypothetical protein SynA1524_02079 [Synechococcus sp. A15-24]|nr:hypothetical protein SynA1524_02079 [Synechococcus sp. A15-24]
MLVEESCDSKIKNNQFQPTEKDSKRSQHLRQAEAFFQQAQALIEKSEDWHGCGSLILKGLSEERKAQNSGIQVMNMIRKRPKIRVEFSFRS